MGVVCVVSASNLGCIIMTKKIMTIKMMTYRDCSDVFLEIGSARKCFKTTRALGVAICVVDRAAQQSEKIQHENDKNKN